MDPVQKTHENVKTENGYYVFTDIPIFDVHNEHDSKGNLIDRYDRQRLQDICDYNNRKFKSANYACAGPGHTEDDKPEEFQPPVWSFVGNFKVVDGFGPQNIPGITADFYVKKKVLYQGKWVSGREYFKEFPKRSIEIDRNTGEIDWIALLRRTAFRPVGVVQYSKENYSATKFCPWIIGDDIFDSVGAEKKKLKASISKNKNKLRYSMRDYMPVKMEKDPEEVSDIPGDEIDNVENPVVPPVPSEDGIEVENVDPVDPAPDAPVDPVIQETTLPKPGEEKLGDGSPDEVPSDVQITPEDMEVLKKVFTMLTPILHKLVGGSDIAKYGETGPGVAGGNNTAIPGWGKPDKNKYSKGEVEEKPMVDPEKTNMKEGSTIVECEKPNEKDIDKAKYSKLEQERADLAKALEDERKRNAELAQKNAELDRKERLARYSKILNQLSTEFNFNATSELEECKDMSEEQFEKHQSKTIRKYSKREQAPNLRSIPDVGGDGQKEVPFYSDEARVKAQKAVSEVTRRGGNYDAIFKQV